MKRLLLAGVGLGDRGDCRHSPPTCRRRDHCRRPAHRPMCRSSPGTASMSASTPATASASSQWTDTVTRISTGKFNISGGLVGGTAGYNVQFGTVVFGLEGDIDWSDIKGSTTATASAPARPPTTGSARRAGGSVTPSTASCPISPAARPSATSKARCSASATSRQTKVGWTAGAGSNTPSSTTGRPRSNISMSISARRPATRPAPAAIRST